MVETFVTPNHKLYVKSRYKTVFELVEAQNVYKKRFQFKRNCANINEHAQTCALRLGDDIKNYDMEHYLKLLGMFYSDARFNNDRFIITTNKKNKVFYLDKIGRVLELNWQKTINGEQTTYTFIDQHDPLLFSRLKNLIVPRTGKLPEFVWQLSEKNCQHLMDGFIYGDGSMRKNTQVIMFYTSDAILVDEIQKLAFHCGWSANISIVRDAGERSVNNAAEGQEVQNDSNSATAYRVGINRHKNEPQINHGHVHQQNGQSEQWVDYKGQVGCLEIPETHLFYYRENKLAPPHWSGNSSRQG